METSHRNLIFELSKIQIQSHILENWCQHPHTENSRWCDRSSSSLRQTAGGLARKCCPGQRAMPGPSTRSAAARLRAGQWNSVQLDTVSIDMKLNKLVNDGSQGTWTQPSNIALAPFSSLLARFSHTFSLLRCISSSSLHPWSAQQLFYILSAFFCTPSWHNDNAIINPS